MSAESCVGNMMHQCSDGLIMVSYDLPMTVGHAVMYGVYIAFAIVALLLVLRGIR